MSKKRIYNIITLVIIVAIFAGWTTFLEIHEGKGTEANASEGNIEVAGTNAPSSGAATENVNASQSSEEPVSMAAAETKTDAEAVSNSEAAADSDTASGSETAAGTESSSNSETVAEPEPTSAPEPTSVPEPTPTPEPTAEPEPVQEETPYEIKSYAFAKVQDDFVNIRSIADTSGEKVGKLPKNAYGLLLEKGEAFSKIQSGSITGYVSNKYLYTGSAAIEIMKQYEVFKIRIEGGVVNIRTAPGTDSDIILTASRNQTFVFYPEESTNLWYAIKLSDGSKGYVTATLAVDFIDSSTAVSE